MQLIFRYLRFQYNIRYNVACYEFVVQQRGCLQSRSVATAVSAGFIILVLSKYVTVFSELTDCTA
jgi:hypothetical protein